MRLHNLIYCIILIVSCNKPSIQKFNTLSGTWKIDGKEQYEVWEILDNTEFKGYVYTIENGGKVISEELQLFKLGDEFVYVARVFNQNKGENVIFRLNLEEKEMWSFENEQHDFPKKIQYKKIDENTLDIQVLGGNNKGFSYRQIRQKQ